MADGDTNKERVQRALFPKRRKKAPKIEVSEKWYRKNPVTLNSKLRQAIMDVLPFDMDKAQADLILRVIFDKVVEGVITDGSVTIQNFGKFYPRFMKGRWRPKNTGYGKFDGLCWSPDRYRLAFTPCTGFRRAMVDKETNGDTGTD
jgi:nucleoid DNA-binding protein